MSKSTYYYQSNCSGNIIETTTRDRYIWADDPGYTEITSRAEGKRRYRDQVRAMLLESIRPGQDVYCVLRHVSRSGMYRVISLLVTLPDGSLWDISQAAISLGVGEQPRGRAQGIGVGGCGMDMGFHLVYQLGYALWPDGTPESHGVRNGKPDRDGGYALRARWI